MQLSSRSRFADVIITRALSGWHMQESKFHAQRMNFFKHEQVNNKVQHRFYLLAELGRATTELPPRIYYGHLTH